CRPSGEPCSAKTCREILQPPIVPQATWSAPLPLFHCSSEIAPSRSTSCRSAHPQNSPNQGRVAKVGLGSVLDYFTSALLAYGVAAALFHRERSGIGQYLSLSLLRSALTIQAGRFVWAESEGRDVARDSGTGGLTGIHPTKDGALYISV